MAWQELGEHVRRWRRARGLRIEDVAIEAGVSRSWLSNLERGHKVKADGVGRLATYMKEDPAALLRLAGELPELPTDAGATQPMPEFRSVRELEGEVHALICCAWPSGACARSS